MRINSRGTHVASTSAYEGGCTWQRAAVGEAFGDLAGWEASMFETPFLSGGSRALAVLRLPDDLPTLDPDDPRVLLERALLPTQIVVRNLTVTPAWAHAIWDERDPHDAAALRWQAVQWWSYHRPTWEVIASWERPELVRAEALRLDHPAVVEAAQALQRPLRWPSRTRRRSGQAGPPSCSTCEAVSRVCSVAAMAQRKLN